jgi:hypothetical protein
MRLEPKRILITLVVVQAADALFTAIPSTLLKDNLDQLGLRQDLRVLLPIAKGSSALGLLAGLRWPTLGRLTAVALLVYFVAALGFHARAHDAALRYVPAVAMMGWVALVLRSFPIEDAPAEI